MVGVAKLWSHQLILIVIVKLFFVGMFWAAGLSDNFSLY